MTDHEKIIWIFLTPLFKCWVHLTWLFLLKRRKGDGRFKRWTCLACLLPAFQQWRCDVLRVLGCQLGELGQKLTVILVLIVEPANLTVWTNRLVQLIVNPKLPVILKKLENINIQPPTTVLCICGFYPSSLCAKIWLPSSLVMCKVLFPPPVPEIKTA